MTEEIVENEEALRLEDWSEEEIKDELVDLEDLNKLDKKAQIYLKKLQKIEKDLLIFLIPSFLTIKLAASVSVTLKKTKNTLF